MVEIVLRAATAADAAALSALDVAVWRASYGHILSRAVLDGLDRSPFHDPHYFAAIIDRSGVEEWLWMVEADGRAAGYCHFGACRDAASGHGGELERLYLLPAVQGRGLGTRILAAAAHRLVDEGLTPIRTTVFEDNLRARRLYERLGACDLGRQVAFEDQGKPLWECVYGWPDPAPLLRPGDFGGEVGVGKERSRG
jgi:RimJ/RimL family protein N-acetyltransferase